MARRPGAKQYSPPRVTTNGGRSCSRRRIGRWGMVKLPEPSFGPTSGSFSAGAPMKMPSFSHWVLTNSNWRLRCAPAKTKMMPAVGAVVLEHAVGQHRAVARAAPDHAVQADVDAALAVERVARVRASRVRAGRALEAAQIVAVAEVVVAARVGAELGIVPLRGERERRAALPAPDHLGAEQRLVLAARGLRAQVLPVRRHLRVQLAEDDVGAVAAEHVRRRHRRQLAGLVGVAEDDLAGLERPLLRVRRAACRCPRPPAGRSRP